MNYFSLKQLVFPPTAAWMCSLDSCESLSVIKMQNQAVFYFSSPRLLQYLLAVVSSLAYRDLH